MREQVAADVGARVGVQQGALARALVDREQRRGVAVARVEHVQHPAVGGQPQRRRRQRVLEPDLLAQPPAVLGAREQVGAGVRALPHRVPQPVVVVGEVAREALGVLLDERALAGDEVDAVDVVQLGVAVVHADEHLVRHPLAEVDDVGARVLVRRQVERLAAGDVDPEQVEVLVAAGVAQVQQHVGAVGPEVRTDAPRGVARDRPRRGGFVGRGHPDVEDAVQRGQPGQVAAVRAEPDGGALGVAEQRVAGDEVDVG